jgi:uncharacterized protein YoxC
MVRLVSFNLTFKNQKQKYRRKKMKKIIDFITNFKKPLPIVLLVIVAAVLGYLIIQEKQKIQKNVQNLSTRLEACQKSKDALKNEKQKLVDENKKLNQDLEDLNKKQAELDQCIGDFDQQKKVLEGVGEEVAMLYDELALCQESTPEEMKRQICLQRGGIFEDGECQCTLGANGQCVDSAEAMEKLCTESGGEWEKGRCNCGKGMMFSSEKGCVQRPLPREARQIIAAQTKKIKELEEEVKSLKYRLSLPPKVLVKGGRIVSCSPPGSCEEMQ